MAQQFRSLTKDGADTSVYISTNKGVFETGEDLWFKTTVLDAQVFLPSPIDKTLYVQLRNNQNDSLVWSEKYKIVNGFSDGHIYLADTLEVGDYLLEVYSRHSIKSGTKEYHGVRKIKLVDRIDEFIKKTETVDSAEKKDAPDVVRQTAPDIQFDLFPEGGSLIDGIESTLAFKAIDNTGMPIGVKGTLYENEKPLLKFKTFHAGMGSFSFVPNINNDYSVKLGLKDKSDSISYEIPKIQRNGLSLHLARRDPEKLVFKIRGNTVDEQLYLRVQIRGQVQAMASAHIQEQDGLELGIPTKDLPQGICEVTLFDEMKRPVAERLVYVNLEKRLQVAATFSKEVYETRQKVQLMVKATDKDGNPIRSNLGLSVYDKLYKNKEDGKNILTHYELSTQLKGKIYDPKYYFDEKNEDRQKALDLLLLTQGWRRYVWSEKELKEDKGDLILEDGFTGMVSTVRSKKHTPDQQGVMIIDPAQGDIVNLLPLDSLKHFYLKPDYLGLGPRIYIRHFEPDHGPEVQVKTSDGFAVLKGEAVNYADVYPINDNNPKKEPPVVSSSMSQGINLNEVLIQGDKAQGFRDKYLGTLDSLAKLNINTDYVCNSNILNCEVHKFSDDNRKPVEGETYQQYVGFEWNGDHSAYTIKGRRSITYHYPQFTEAELLEKFNLTKVKGYYKEKEFYEPDYDKEDDSFPDYRNTLVWKPQIITDKNGEAEITFFCSDISSHFVGVIEGVSANGLLGREEFKFFVKKH